MARYALVIGIAKYNSPSLHDLSKTATDAEAIAQMLERHGNYRVTLINQEVTAWQLAHQLEQFLLEQASHNEALIYFTGHGIKGITGADYLEQSKVYLAASDCKVIKANSQWTIREGGVSLSSLNKLIQKSILGNLIVILDACHSGEFVEKDLNNAFNSFNSRKDYFLITACRRAEKALAKKSDNHSVFSGALLAGLKIEQAWENGQITAGRLFDFIYFQLKNSPQEPIYLGGGRSIALVTYQQPQKTEVLIDETCPYQGLRYFTEEQAKFFFGRKKIVETLKQKLEQSAFVPLIGASGSGKSSIVRAGLIPWLKEEGWQILDVILPGDEPLNELKRVFTQLVPRTEVNKISSLIETSGLSSAIKYISGSGRLLLIVDQFEEVFSFCSNDEDRSKFIQLLTEISEITDSRLAIVTTMRADFLENCLQYSSLHKLIQNQAVFVSPLLDQDLKDAIVEPTKLQGYSFGEGLLEIILRDINSERGCLPLLEFTLTEIWKLATKENYRLTVAQYQKIDGLQGALNRQAEKIYQEIGKNFDHEGEKWIKLVFLKLVRTGEDVKDTRQRRLKIKLLSLARDEESRKILNIILDKLVYERLLTANKQGWIDLSHEALMEAWEKFAEWRQLERELRRIVDRVEDAYKEWQKDSSDKNLMMGGLIEQVQEQWIKIQSWLDHDTLIYCQNSFNKTTLEIGMNWQRVAHKLREYNRKLLRKVFKLENELALIENLELKKNNNQNESLAKKSNEITEKVNLSRQSSNLEEDNDLLKKKIIELEQKIEVLKNNKLDKS